MPNRNARISEGRGAAATINHYNVAPAAMTCANP